MVVANGERLTVQIYGQKMEEKIERKSVVIEEIPAPENLVFDDDSGAYPDLYEGESRVIKYGAKGYKSEGYLFVTKNGKTTSVKFRTDRYAPMRGKTVIGKAKSPIDEVIDDGKNSKNLGEEEKNIN